MFSQCQHPATGLLAEYNGLIWACLRNVPTNDRDDVYQNIACILLRSHGQIRTSAKWPWVRKICQSSVAYHYRKRALLLRVGGESVNEDEPGREENPLCEACRREEARIVRSAVRGLKPSFRRVIRAVYWRGEAMKDFAGRTGISHTATRNRIIRARTELREKLEPLMR